MLLAILRSVGNLNVSVIHRQMRCEHEGMLSILGLRKRKFISDSQFRRILNSIDYQSYNALNDRYFGVSVAETSGEWKAVNGKELRGNIGRRSVDGLSRQKPGENVVKMVSHEDKIKCKESGRIRMIASAVNNAVNRVRKFNINGSITAFREEMIFDR